MIENPSFDCKKRVIDYRGEIVTIYFLSSLCKEDLIAYLVHGIVEDKGKDFLDCLNNGDVSLQMDTNKLEYALYSGCCVLFYKKLSYVLEMRNFPSRSIQEPETEKSVRGAKDGFNENLVVNVALLRRRIKSPTFLCMVETIGSTNKIDICLCYLEDKIEADLLKQVKSRISKIKANDFIMSDRAIEELIMDQGYNPFPLVRYSERPDVVATHIVHGYLAVIVDTSSSVIMLPTTLFELLENVEEYRQAPIIGTSVRLLRYFAVFLSVFMIPIWFFHTDVTNLLIIQVFIVDVAIELLRLATIHTPTSLSNAMGVVAAILLGQFAINLGMFSEEVLLVSAISNISGFANPSYELSLTNKYIRMLGVIVFYFFREAGMITYFVILFFYLLSLRPFGHGYLYPLIPFNNKAFIKHLIRKPK
ncbi:spore germination protein [Tannockella kyphosi]|uniref:spore germination protein n=1 Tax=Tannockella kyphosi TaxID=2899121 RepID=UPI0020122A8C|nr:spore germination protein [Tannockella kyphosi]